LRGKIKLRNRRRSRSHRWICSHELSVSQSAAAGGTLALQAAKSCVRSQIAKMSQPER
jgi:hypothetical protein